MLNFGYVKVKTGKFKGRIARYIRDDLENKKAVIAFNYQIDIIPFSSFYKLPFSYLTNDIEKRDLVERYYDIVENLKKIDVKADKDIKKYSKEHIDLITEGDLIRGLLENFYSVNNLTSMKKEENITIFFSFKDILWVNDFSLDLEESDFLVAFNSHETWINDLNTYLNKSNTYIFVISNNSLDSSWLKEEYYFLENNSNKESNLITVVIDDIKVDKYFKQNYYLGELFSDTYNEGLSHIINGLNNY